MDLLKGTNYEAHYGVFLHVLLPLSFNPRHCAGSEWLLCVVHGNGEINRCFVLYLGFGMIFGK